MNRKCRDGLGLADVGVIDAELAPETVEEYVRSSMPSPFANDTTLERADDVVPCVVAAVVGLLTSGQLAPHRLAIRRHLPDRALDQAMKKLEYLRRQ